MSGRIAYAGARIFDGDRWHDRAALVVEGDRVVAIVPEDDTPADAARVTLGGGFLAPGLIDVQVNGGGGALLNLTPDIAAIETICATYMRFGTTGCLPTFITDTPENVATVLRAGAEAARRRVPGFLGLHMEGPHLSVARRGAHDPSLIRPMDEPDLEGLLAARKTMPHLLTTVAAETVTPAQIKRLVAGGVIVSIGHSEASYAQVEAAQQAGATLVTHLFNAQSQMGNREPGVVGAALDLGGLSASLIADGIHVHPASIGAALRAKRGPGRVLLITDAMQPTGTDMESFVLTGRTVHRKDGALRLADGTLAGADLTLPDAVRYLRDTIGVDLGEALRMASLYPAQVLGIAGERGRIAAGARADFAHFADDLTPLGTFVAGALVRSPVDGA